MKELIIGYYHLSKLHDKYNHNDVFDYTKEKLDEVQTDCLESGLTYMTIPYEDRVIVLIGKGKLTQR